VLDLPVGDTRRLVAVEDASRYRDTIGVQLPPSLPGSLRTAVNDPIGDLVRRFARTHGPFHAEDVARRLGLGIDATRQALARLARPAAWCRGSSGRRIRAGVV